jgi:hypothetical protein
MAYQRISFQMTRVRRPLHNASRTEPVRIELLTRQQTVLRSLRLELTVDPIQ